MPRIVVGCMTGTSLDGIDGALVRVRGEGLGLRAEVVRHVSGPLGGVGAGLRRLADGEPMSADEIAGLALGLGAAHVPVIRGVLDGERADLIAVHGQTVFHRPPVSWQLIQPAPIAAAFGCAVVSDLRASDLAAGGEGAPITPLADLVLFGSDAESRAIVNLGGFCNVTLLPAGGGIDDVGAADVCACNHVLDGLARRRLGEPFDRDGAVAMAGRPDDRLVSELCALLGAQSGLKRSLGTGDEVREWIETASGEGADVLASACAAVARTIADRVGAAERVVLAGGGVKNAALAAALRSACTGEVVPSDELGVPAAAREAAAMAVLGALADDGVPITLPGVTGRDRNCLTAGSWIRRGTEGSS